MYEDAIDDLRAFNDMVEALTQGRFAAHMNAHGTGHEFRKTPDGTWAFKDFGPDYEATEAAVLRLRQFLFRGDRISLESMDKLYRLLPLDADTLDAVRKHSANLNDHLDSPLPINSPSGDVPTYRTVVDVFLNGRFAHLDRKKAAVLRRWETNPLMFETLRETFLHTMADILDAASWLRDMNVRTIATLEEVQTNPSISRG